MVRKAVFVGLGFFLVFGNILAVQTFDLVDVDRDSSFIAMAGPLRVLSIEIVSWLSLPELNLEGALTINRALS